MARLEAGGIHSGKVDNAAPLSAARFYILLSLVEGPRHGYAIMRTVRDVTGGAVRLSPGTVYQVLSTFVHAKLIEETTSGEPAVDERRRSYRLCPLGWRVLAEESRRMAAAVAIIRARRIPEAHR